MTTQRDADRILRAWLDLMPDEAPDRAVAAVLQAVETTPQRRRRIAFGPRRSTSMTRFALIAAAAALGVALLGGALLVGGRPSTIAPTPAPATIPSPPAPSPTVAPTPAPEALRANWLADAAGQSILGDGTGLIRLVVSANGASAWMLAPSGNEAGRSTVHSAAPDILELSLDRERPGCAAGAVGRYRWSVTDDRLHLTLEAIEDECAARAEAMGRTWTRTHVGASDGGTAVVPDVGPLFQVTLPAGSYTTRPMTDAQEIFDQPRDYILYAWKNPQGFASPCTMRDRYPWEPGAQAFVDYIDQSDAFTNVRTEATTVGGYPAIHLQFESVDSYAPCPDAEWLMQLVPKDMPEGEWHIGFGEPDSYYVVDHPDATMLFQVLPVGDASEADVMQSIQFLEGLPKAP
jgi:hypothetical protein